MESTPAHAQDQHLSSLSGFEVILRDKKKVTFDASKISNAVSQAFIAVASELFGDADVNLAKQIQATSTHITHIIVQRLVARCPEGGSIHIEAIQDQVELTLMHAESLLADYVESGACDSREILAWTPEQYFKVCREYIVYREHRHQLREELDSPQLQMQDARGQEKNYTVKGLTRLVAACCKGIDGVCAEVIAEEAFKNLFKNASWADIQQAFIMSARTLIEKEPQYSFAAAALLSHRLLSEVCEFYEVSAKQLNTRYQQCFKRFITHGLAEKLLDERFTVFDLDVLAKALNPSQDQLIN